MGITMECRRPIQNGHAARIFLKYSKYGRKNMFFFMLNYVEAYTNQNHFVLNIDSQNLG